MKGPPNKAFHIMTCGSFDTDPHVRYDWKTRVLGHFAGISLLKNPPFLGVTSDLVTSGRWMNGHSTQPWHQHPYLSVGPTPATRFELIFVPINLVQVH